jgi:type I restriction enzyme, S subunit
MKKGWKTKKLAETCEMYQPKTISGKEMVADGAYPVYGANGVIGRYSQFNHEESQLLITCRGATCGSVNISQPRSWVTGNAMVVRPKTESLDMRYLEYLFRGGIDISKAITGAAQPQITRTNLETLEISYPESLAEQQRIVGILDEAFDGIATAKANAEKNLQNARALFESHLQSVFTQRGPGWVEKKLGDVCEFENGDRGKNYPHRREYVESGIPWINTGHIQRDGTLSENDMNFISPKKFKSLRSGKIQSGDLVYCLRGATLGKTALVDPLTVGAVASSLVILRPTSLLDSRYLYSFLTSSLGQGLIKGFENGAAQPNLGAKSVAKYPISIPPIAEQKQLVAKLDSLRAETQRLARLYEWKLAALETLKKSLLHQAFSGEL